MRRFNELLLRFLPIGVVIIDRNYRILTANGAARRFLNLHDATLDHDFLHAVRGVPYHEIRSAIDSVFRERNFVTLPEVELETASGGNGRFISLSITLMQLDNTSPDLAAISITDVNDQVQVRRQLEAIQIEQTNLMQELGTANKRLSDMNKELMDANEELQVANEELMLTHEELQASIEEFETTNEELQATNEELETNNEELQATNEELETTNDELRARTNELQEMAANLDSERGRLLEMVELAPFSILVLRGPGLIVEAYNPHYTHVFEGREVLGFALEDVIDIFWEPRVGIALTRLAHEVYVEGTPQTTPRIQTVAPGIHEEMYQEQQETYFSYTVVPSHNAYGQVNGIIIYAADETKQHLREIKEEFEQLKAIFTNMKTAALALYDAQTQALIMGSPLYLTLATLFHNNTLADVTNLTWAETTLLPPEEAAQKWQEIIEKRVALRTSEITVTSQDAETVWDYDLNPIMDRENPDQIIYVLVSALEITKQAQTRKNLEQLDQLRDDFLAQVTHELRSPLTSIQANIQLVQRILKKHVAMLPTTQVQEQRLDQGLTRLDRVHHQLQHMNRLIEEMLDVARLNEEILKITLQEDVNLIELIQRSIEQQSSPEHSITLQNSEPVIPVTIDDGRIEQVLNNLLSNAIKYTPADSPIIVTVERQQEKQEVIVAVHDNGNGIREEDQEHLFDRFYRGHTSDTENQQGLGLGLYIARGMILQHGGRMWLESRLNEGSTFFFSLPLTQH